MNKKETIMHLTKMMATIQMAYFKGHLARTSLMVHECSDRSAAISIDLYNLCGGGKPLCDGLMSCAIIYDDSSTDKGDLLSMCYAPEDVTPLVFLFSPSDDAANIEIDPEDVPEETLRNIEAWLEKHMHVKSAKPAM